MGWNKNSYKLSDKSYFKLRQIISSIAKTWKKVLRENQSDRSNLVLLYHQMLKNRHTLGTEKMNPIVMKKWIIISSKVKIPTSRIYF